MWSVSFHESMKGTSKSLLSSVKCEQSKALLSLLDISSLPIGGFSVYNQNLSISKYIGIYALLANELLDILQTFFLDR